MPPKNNRFYAWRNAQRFKKQRRDDFADDDDDEEEELPPDLRRDDDEEEEEVQNPLQNYAPPQLRRGVGPARANPGRPNRVIAARPAVGLPPQMPLGNYRRGNGTLAQVVSWACTLWLNEDEPTEAQMQMMMPPPRPVNHAGYRPPDPSPNPPPFAHLVYIRYQLERGDNGQLGFGPNRLHLQMTLEFSERVSALQVIEIMGWRRIPMGDIWLQPVAGNRQNWLNYCWKDETCVDPASRHEAGELRPWNVAQVPAQIRGMVQADADFDEIADEYPDYALRHANNIMRQITEYEKSASPIQRFVNAYCFWGDTGTGKTHAVWSSFPTANIYTKTTGKFFEGYQPKRQNVLVIDECPGDFHVEDMLKVIQGHPMIVEVKGGSVRARWDTVICTANKPPSQWFPHMETRHKEALLRRFNKGIIKFVDSSIRANITKHENEKASALFPVEHARVKMVDCEEIQRMQERQRAEEMGDRPDPFEDY